MGTFGENLRREREMRGVTLEEIRDATKISLRTLQALEADKFDKLPGGIFTRSFVRAYAKYLGLDEESVLAEFQLVAPASAQPTNLVRMSQQRPARPEGGSRAGLRSLLAALLLLAGGFAYYRYARRAPKTLAGSAPESFEPSPAASTEAPPARPPEVAANPASQPAGASPTGNVGTPSAAPGSAPAAAGSSEAPAPGAGKDLILQVAATEQSWVAVESDGKPAARRLMEPNEIQTFRAATSFDLTTGNAEGIILTLNGKTLAPLGHSGEVKKVHLTLNDVQNVTP